MRQIKDIPKPAAAKRPWWRPGPGAIVALVVAAAIVAWQISRPPGPDAGRITYEADANGRLRRVDRPSLRNAARTAPPPFWKPEAHLLLERDRELRLTATQRAALRKLDAKWKLEKARLQQRLAENTREANTLLQRAAPEHGASLTAVRTGLEDYSRLSEEYDGRRAGFWMRARGLLTSLQRQQFDRLKSTPGKK